MNSKKAKTGDLAKRSILVIEDEKSLATVLAVFLTRNGFNVWVAPTGKEGLDLAEQYNCDLILSDIDLPDMNGFEVCRRLKASSKFNRVPLIMMSGRHPDGNQAKAIKVGAVDYLTKPFDMEGLVDRLSSHIKSP